MTDCIETAFSGRIGQDPQLRQSKSGKAWLSFSLAVGSGDEAQWVSVAVFGDRAIELSGSLHKGDRAYVEGRLKLNTWADKDGRERSGLQVAATLVQPLGQIGRRKPSEASFLATAKPSAGRSREPERNAGHRPAPDFSDSLPIYLGA